MKTGGKKLINLLRRAQARIKNGKDNYLCCAIERSVISSSKSDRASAKYLDRWIKNALGDHGTVRSWLAFEHGVSVRCMGEDAMREYRLEWIDQMIGLIKGY